MSPRALSRGARRRIPIYRGAEKGLGESVQLEDTSIRRFPARQLARNAAGDPGKEAHLAHLFIDQNRKTLGQFNIEARVDYDGKNVSIVFESGSSIGAFSLISPLSGKQEVSVLVSPRFGWGGLGASLGISGFKVIPEVLPLGLLPKTERQIPPWVLSVTIIPRLRALIQRISRKFEMVEEVRSAPCGTVDWEAYASEKVPAMKLLEVPCRHPDLVTNRELRAAIHFALRKQLSSLETQRTAGGVVFELIRMCTELMRTVDDVAPRAPTSRQLESWFKTPLATTHLLQGLNAIEWTRDETGLGGVADWRGLPWTMSMEHFYEAWVETIFAHFARRFGGHLRVGRRRETVTPIAWERAYLGSQKFLLPDVVLEQENRTIFVDAKYKNHFDLLRERGWGGLEAEIQERHREDLLQVLAYSALSSTKATTACLTYPCSLDTWDALKGREQLVHRGAIYAGTRRIELVLAAIPMGKQPQELIDSIAMAFVE